MEYSLTQFSQRSTHLRLRLNPYSNGILSDYYEYIIYPTTLQVLILILMEYSLTSNKQNELCSTYES